MAKDRRRRGTGDVGALRFDAGSLSLNLVATVARRFADPVERLTSVESLRGWLSSVGLDVDAALTDEDLAGLRRLRESLDELFRCALAGTQPSAVALAEVNTAAGSSVLQLSPNGVGLAVARDAASPLDAVMALVAADAIRVVTGHERGDLRVCNADDCRMLYLAHGGRARRWCSSERCGNRSRVAAHRARAAGNRAATRGEIS
ncbi:MAG: CGNR zinc finger domain-containing protein [Gaiellaceae bacterium]